MRTVDHRHWTEGGTLVTNISSDLEATRDAVAEFGKPWLVLTDRPGEPESKALHYLRDRSGDGVVDISGFWMLVMCIRAERQFGEAKA